jgi:hypothetical protein
MKRIASVLVLGLVIVVAGLLTSGVWQASAGSLFAPPPTSTPGPPPPTPFGFKVPPTPIPMCDSEWFPSPKSPDRPCGTPVTSPDKIPAQVILPTLTPIPFARTIDLGPNVPLQCKREIVIRRSNGQYEKFLIPYGQDRSKYTSTLKPGDEITFEPPVYPPGPPPLPPTFTADGKVLFAPPPTSVCP